MTIRIGYARPWEAWELLILCMAGVIAGDALRREREAQDWHDLDVIPRQRRPRRKAG